MRPRTMATTLLLALALVGAGYVLIGGERAGSDRHQTEQAEASLPADGVVVYYFHGTKRCATCNRLESLAEAVVRERFADRLASGDVVFRSVNVESDATRHFVTDYDLASKAVVMVARRGGEDVSWRRLDEIWEKIADEPAYRAYIADNLTACLARTGGAAG